MRIDNLLTEETWTKGEHARDSNDVVCSPTSIEAQKFDLMGALIYCYPDSEERGVKLRKLKSLLKVRQGFKGPLHKWNDGVEYVDVESLLRWFDG
jgi:hypothetical protein